MGSIIYTNFPNTFGGNQPPQKMAKDSGNFNMLKNDEIRNLDMGKIGWLFFFNYVLVSAGKSWTAGTETTRGLDFLKFLATFWWEIKFYYVVRDVIISENYNITSFLFSWKDFILPCLWQISRCFFFNAISSINSKRNIFGWIAGSEASSRCSLSACSLGQNQWHYTIIVQLLSVITSS